MPADCRVLIVDDHDYVRSGLRTLLEAEGGVSVVGEAENGVAAVEMADSLQPHVVLMDYNMPQMNGLEATRQIKARQPGVQIIGLSMHVEGVIKQEMLAAGAAAFHSKCDELNQLLDTVRMLGSGLSP